MIDQREALEQGAGALGLPLTDQQARRLMAFAGLILKWNKVYNLTALRDPQAVLTHHLLDSLAVIGPLARVWPGKANLLDVGAGAGLPGAVIAVMRDDILVDCVDAVAKKAAFVQQTAVELQLPNLRGVHERVESLTGQYDVICSRAFATLRDFCGSSAHLLVPGGVWMAMKGKIPFDEIAALPVDVKMFHVEQLAVPGLDAKRCIVWARKKID